MKNLLKSALIAVGVLMMGSFAKAQSKVGHIDFQKLVTTDPAFAGLQKQINDYQNTFIESLKSMQTEFQTKANDYEAKRATMNDALRTKTEGELQDLQKRIQDQNTTAQNAVNQKQEEMMKPLIDKYKAAISQVAKEKGYNYVLDSSQTSLLVAPDADDLMAAVKAKVGNTTAAAPASTTPKTSPTAKKP